MPDEAGEQADAEATGPVTVPAPRAAAVVVARDHGALVGETVRAVAEVAGIDLVLVVDDGSRDDTWVRARDADAVVVSHPRPLGPAAAYETGATAVAGFELGETRSVARHLLFVDASLGEMAKEAGGLSAPVFDRRADLVVGAVPTVAGAAPLAAFAGQGIARATGWRPHAPLSRQCCLTREAFEAARPLSRGAGLPVGLLIDVHRHGFRVVEVPVEFGTAAEAPGSAAPATSRRPGPRPWAEVASALARRGVLPPARTLRMRRDAPD